MATNWPNSVQTFTNPSAGDSLNSPSHSAQHTTVNDTVEALQTYAGLVLVKTQNIGSGVSSVTVTDAFSSTFYNYKVILSSLYTTTVDYLRLQFPGHTSSGYYFNRLTLFVNSATGLTNSTNGYNGGHIDIGSGGTARQGFVSLDIYAPAVTRRTGVGGTFYGSGYNGIVNGEHASNVAHTSFTLTMASGTFSGGEIYVYGYNDG